MKLKCIATDGIPSGRLTVGKIYDGEPVVGGYDLHDDRGVREYYLRRRFEILDNPLFEVKCVDNDGVSSVLTVGSIYQVVSHDNQFYYLIGARSGLSHGGFTKTRFEPVLLKAVPTLSSIVASALSTDEEEARLRRILTSVGHSNSCSSCGAPLPCKWHP